jgi:hypothetical protein
MSYASGKRFLLVTFAFAGKMKTKELEPVFNRGINWVRYAANCWIVLTKQNPNVWAKRLQPLLDEKDQYFIVDIDLAQRQGKLPKWVWDWIKEHQAEVELEDVFE